MSDWAVKAERLGKKYRLQHRNRPRYTALRDVIADTARSLIRRSDPFASAEDFWALKDVEFEIGSGEIVGIVGRNGAGKSTLLKILSRITDPTEGTVRLRGHVASLLEVGTGFHPELTGRENIFLNGAILGMTRSEIKRKFDEIVAFAEVERFLDTPVKRYSSGMYVRLAFAVAAHLEPEILIVDEVLAVGDAEFQKKSIGKMRDVASSEGRTVLFVSHNMAAVSALCSRALLMEAGRVTLSGSVDDIIARYLSTSASPIIRSDARDEPRIVCVRIDPDRLLAGGLRVEVDFRSPRPLNPLLIGLVVSSAQGVPVFGFNSQMDSRFNQAPVDHGTAIFELGSLRVHPGLYRLSVWLGEKDQNLDHLADAAMFDVVGPITLPHGVSVDSVGSMKVDGRWSVQPRVDNLVLPHRR